MTPAVWVVDATGRLVEVREDANYGDLSSSTVTYYKRRADPSYIPVQRWIYYPGSQIYQQSTVYATPYSYSDIEQGVQTRTFKRDGLGRLASETHLESGTTTYAWSDAGRLTTKTDARGIVTTLSASLPAYPRL